VKAQTSVQGNHVFRNTDTEIEKLYRTRGCKKKHREGEGEGEELPQNKCSYSLPEKILLVIRLYTLNMRKMVHLLFMMSYPGFEWKLYFNPNFQEISIIFK